MKLHIGKKSGMLVKFILKEEEVKCETLKSFVNNKYFTRENGETFVNLKCEEPRLLVGLGDPKEINADTLKVAGLKAARELNRLEQKEATILLPQIEGKNQKESALLVLEGMLNGSYNFDKYKKEKKTWYLESVTLDENSSFGLEENDLKELLAKWEGIKFARDLVNRTANDIIPKTLAKEAESLKELGVDVKIYDKSEIEKIGMKAFLEVAKGSKNEPKLIVMEYKKTDNPPIAFVGKGLTYDSGGYSLKPSDGMKTMKSDMGGSATVIGAIKAIATAGLNTHVVGVVATCENMVDGGAYKPGDVIHSLRGLTIEVDNTDAEGRLTLADAVCYAENTFSPKIIIELATLTGACVVAMGEHTAGILGNDQESIEYVLQSAGGEFERAWSLPYGKDFQDLNKSDIADIKNTGGRWGGASSAGEFVGAFIDHTKFVHIDIAGPAYNSKPFHAEPQGGTGVMVKTLFRIAKENK